MNKHINQFAILLGLLLYGMQPTSLHGLWDDIDNNTAGMQDDKDEQYGWTFPVTFYYAFANRSFDNCWQANSLSNLLFFGDPVIEDISLFSKLCEENKVRINNIDALVPDRGSTPLSVQQAPFGAFSSDLYPTLLSQTAVAIESEYHEIGALFTMLYSCEFCSDWLATVGLTIPFKSRLHIMDLSFEGGILFREAFSIDLTNRENTANEFFSEYISVEDYFLSGILAPKGIEFTPRRRKNGIGDLTLFFMIERPIECASLRTLQLGTGLVMPSGGRPNQEYLWDPVLGNGGAFQFDFFVNAQWETCSAWLNPFARIALEVSIPFTRLYRIPKLIVQDVAPRTSVRDVLELYTPELFRSGTGYYVDTFSEYDSHAMLFPDHAVPTRTRFGTKGTFGLGNYFEGLFHCNIKIGILYEYMMKTKDHLSVHECNTCTEPAEYDTQFAECRTHQRAHILGWNVSYNNGCFETSLGSYHVVAGLNVPRHNELFVSFVLTY